MLYERWRQVVREHGSELALVDLPGGQRWTFVQLDKCAEDRSVRGVSYPSGHGAGFIFSVLGAWRTGHAVCPLEPDQLPPPCEGVPPDIRHMKTTSATTGAARLVLFTAAQLMADAENIVTTMGLRVDWPNLGVISMAHSYGFSSLVLPLLLHGIPLFLLDSPMPQALRSLVSPAPFLTVPAVPALWRAWHEADVIPANTRLAISAGAPLPLSLETGVYRKTGLKLHNFYGASECGGIAYDRSDRLREDPALVGVPLDHVRLATTAEGCLEVRSAAVATRYWPEPDHRLGSGVYQTSDLAALCDGKVYLRGRASDQINVAGRKLAPEGVEQVLRQCSGVRDCLVFGVPSPDPGRGEDIVACLVLVPDADRQAVRRRTRALLPAWQVPRRWWYVDSLDTNQRGKLSRAIWRQRYLQETGSAE